LNVIPSSREILTVPALLIVLGLFFHFFGIISFVNSKRVPFIRWLAVACYLGALFFAMQPLLRYFDGETGFIYRSELSRLTHAAHFLAFGVPLVLLIGSFFLDRAWRRRAAMTERLD
jgi:hypothetical protein